MNIETKLNEQNLNTYEWQYIADLMYSYSPQGESYGKK